MTSFWFVCSNDLELLLQYNPRSGIRLVVWLPYKLHLILFPLILCVLWASWFCQLSNATITLQITTKYQEHMTIMYCSYIPCGWLENYRSCLCLLNVWGSAESHEGTLKQLGAMQMSVIPQQAILVTLSWQLETMQGKVSGSTQGLGLELAHVTSITFC